MKSSGMQQGLPLPSTVSVVKGGRFSETSLPTIVPQSLL